MKSANPEAKPAIAPNYLATEHDQQEAIAGCRMLQRLAASKPMQAYISEQFTPSRRPQTDDELLADFRQRCNTVYHACGTCRMGDSAENAVVDQQLAVYGTQGLYVMDASVFPLITSGNTNAPTMMLAARAAAGIRG